MNGKLLDSVLVSSTDGSTDDTDAKAVISFGSPPPDQSVINYVVYSKINSFSKIELQEFTGDGSTADFTLTKTPYSAKPNSHNVIVKVNDKILNPGYNEQFDITAKQREYRLEIWQTPIGSFEEKDILAQFFASFQFFSFSDLHRCLQSADSGPRVLTLMFLILCFLLCFSMHFL